MKDSIVHKLETLKERHEEISVSLSDAEIVKDQTRFAALSREYSQLEPIVKKFDEHRRLMKDLAYAQELLGDQDVSLKKMAQEETKATTRRIDQLEGELQVLLLPKDPHDQGNVFLEVRAGTGGDEAAIFAGDLFRMYSRYAENKKWKIEVLNKSEGDHGGYKEIIAKISGTDVYSNL
ncbi:MAG: PCRF domain-containing protein, partial [Gammaproteobacteria bacterium]|nr:PCRF domain-containing protein [Gammaproteobacteria bacterium]